MTKRITLAKAMKVKNRLAGRLQKIQEEIKVYNSITKGSERPNVAELYAAATRMSEGLVSLKTAMYRANEGIQEAIYRLGELKSRMAFLNDVPTKHGSYNDFGGGQEEYVAVIRYDDIQNTLQNLETEADELQDRLDAYNAKTEIDIDDTLLNLAPVRSEKKKR